MIYLKKLPFIGSLESMQEIASLDTLANLKKHLAAIGSWVPSDYRKADYVMVSTPISSLIPSGSTTP